jgi:hypothetical protein
MSFCYLNTPYEIRQSVHHPDWFVDTMGKPWRVTEGHLVPARVYVSRYPLVIAGKKRVRVHELVASAFHGVKPLGTQCRHLNDNKCDNRPSNLGWGTGVENVADHIRNNGGKHARSAYGGAISKESLAKALSLMSSGMLYGDVAKVCGVSYRTIHLWRQKYFPRLRHAGGKPKKGTRARPVFMKNQ